MKIYADFNALLDVGGPPRHSLVHLERLGTLRDLCAARLRLREGLTLLLRSDSAEDEDLEIEAKVRWISDPRPPDAGCWVGEFDPAAFRDVPAQAELSISDWFPCGSCGTNLAAEIQRSGLNSSTACVACGTRVHALIAPPTVGV